MVYLLQFHNPTSANVVEGIMKGVLTLSLMMGMCLFTLVCNEYAKSQSNICSMYDLPINSKYCHPMSHCSGESALSVKVFAALHCNIDIAPPLLN